MMDGLQKDPYAHAVMERIDPAIRASFAPAQISAIEAALMRGGPIAKRHPLDIRLSVPLLFARYYIVVMMGRDRRVRTRRAETRRHQELSVFWALLLGFLVASPVLVIILLILYAFKTAIGIDLMPGMHLKDLLKFW